MLERTCKHCGEQIIAVTAHKMYCDENCRLAYFYKTHQGYRRNPEEQKVCKECGKTFTTTIPAKIFCSPQCNFSNQNKKRLTTKMQKRTCSVCGKEFMPMQKRGVGKKYCCRGCAYKVHYKQRKHVTTEKALAYNKKHKMDGNWWPSLRRDKWTCQLCGKYISFLHWNKKRRLVVHHKDGSGETDNKNDSLDNLTSLCIQCHYLFHQVFLVQINGDYFVKGQIFTKLGITEIKVVPQPPS